ncbi:MAG: neutral/alkaline non-lysosomal ceramidase N-terminal domain-containing protein [bacterium]|nr:neutral/alkaline non-lysosomal ceramidase N-terminal domain-containing protein [bacterium]
MKSRSAVALLTTMLFCLSSDCFPAASGESAIHVGLAKVEITPPVGGNMWGYAGRGPSTEVHDPLFARIAYFETADTKLALVSWDVCEFQSPWLRKQLEELGIPNLLLCSTHTHAGPDMDQEDFPSTDKPWRRTVEERILEAVKKAKEETFPAFITAAEGNVTIGYNRLKRERDGTATTYFENPWRIPLGPVDPTVGVIRIDDESGKTRAVIICYACHPVVLGPRNTKISADYPGVAMNRIADYLGGDAMCLFIQGCGGDINALFLGRTGDSEEDFKFVRQAGNLLAKEVEEVLDEMKGKPGRSAELKIRPDVLTFQHRWEPDKTLTLGVASVLVNGEIGIVALPGEPFHIYQNYLRDGADLAHAYVFGYTDSGYHGWPSYYLPDIRSAAYGGYGASDTTAPEVGAGERLLNHGLIQLYTMRGMLKEKPGRPRTFSPSKSDI